MIQRIQTLFLFLVLVCLGLYLWFPLITISEGEHSHVFKGWEIYQFYKGYLYFINAIFAGTAAGFSLIAIFLFKKRKVQALLTWFAIIFIVAAEGFVFYKYQTQACRYDEFLTHSVIECMVKLSAYNLFAVAAVVLELLAFYFIRKDEDLVKSMDRLR